MTEPTRDEETGRRPDTPRWVKAFALAVLVAILVVIGVLLLAGGEHGPMRHGGWIDSVGWTSTVHDG